ncbi:MAG: TVP38/TMEM64 family protein [Deltaproteobacteria bacterium]|nr:MAG: TVP38/TMEM64 family protein [Deltaproteobacteria bacterium]
MTLGLSLKWRIVIGSVLLVALGGALFYFQGKFHVVNVVSFLEWIEGVGTWAPILFILIEMVVVVFILPGFGLIFALGGGFMFGVLKGTLYIVIGTTIGAVIAFMIARHFFGERTSMFILVHSKLKMISDELSHEGWKIVLLTNLVPFFPFKLSHYFFGLTGFSLRDFVIGVFFGIMPITITNAYIGSLAADLSTLGLRSSSRSQADWVIYGIGLVVMIAVVIYITHLARRALDKYISREELP